MISWKIESVFNFSINQQILIDRQISLFFNQRACLIWVNDRENQTDCKKRLSGNQSVRKAIKNDCYAMKKYWQVSKLVNTIQDLFNVLLSWGYTSSCQILVVGKMPWKCEKNWYNAVQRVKKIEVSLCPAAVHKNSQIWYARQFFHCYLPCIYVTHGDIISPCATHHSLNVSDSLKNWL